MALGLLAVIQNHTEKHTLPEAFHQYIRNINTVLFRSDLQERIRLQEASNYIPTPYEYK